MKNRTMYPIKKKQKKKKKEKQKKYFENEIPENPIQNIHNLNEKEIEDRISKEKFQSIQIE